MEASNKMLKDEDEQKVLLYSSKNKGSQPPHLQPKLLTHGIKRCSVIIVSYKTGDILLDCLKSVFEQEAVKQVILVDNGNTRLLMQEVNVLADEEPRLEIITGQGNVGFAGGCNLGARRARHHYILLLNPDSKMGEGVISEALDVFTSHPDASVLTVRIENPDGTEQRGARRNLMTPWTCVVEQFRLDRLAPNHPHFERLNLNETRPLQKISPVQCISGAFMLMPSSVYSDLGGMDEKYFLHVEDVDFCMRVERAGGTILYDPNVKVMHQKSSSDVFPGFIEWHKAKSFCTYFDKHFRNQYPRWILNIFATAIYVRFGLRLVPTTIVWLFNKISSQN